MYKIALLPFIFISFSAFSQNGDQEPYRFPSQIPTEYRVDAKELYDSILDIESIAPDTVRREQVRKFAAQQSYGLRSLFHGGHVYLGWTDMEGYLNDVLQNALSDKKTFPSGLKVYPSTSTGWNARAYFDGTILMDVGFIAELKNEAELAFILAHEAAHVSERDVIDRFFKNVDRTARRKRKRGYEVEQVADALEEAAYSRADEGKADSLGALYLDRSGYGLDHGIQCFKRIRSYKKFYRQIAQDEEDEWGKEDESEVERSIEGLLSSHPKMEERIKSLKHLRYKLENEGAAYKLDEERFKRMRKKARRETLKLLLRKGEYETGIMKGFKYHLLDPEDPLIREYLLRSLRRAQYIDPGKSDQGFLHWVHQGSDNDSVPILDDLHYLIRDSLRFEKIQAERFLQDSNLFRTRGEAYSYFFRSALEDEESYAFLIKGIKRHLTADFAERDSFLEEYLSSSDTANAAFARALQNGGLSRKSSSGERALLLVDRFQLIEDHPYGYRRSFIQEDEKAETYLEGLRRLTEKEFPSQRIETVYMPDLRRDELSMVMKAERIQDLLLKYPEKLFGEELEDRDDRHEDQLRKVIKEHIDQKERRKDSSLFLLAPEYWSFFQKNRISSLEFLYVKGFDDRVKRVKSYFDLFDPWIYLSSLWRFSAAFRTGAERFFLQVGHIRYAPWNKDRLSYRIEASPYDLSKNNFLNAAYYAIGWSRWKDL